MTSTEFYRYRRSKGLCVDCGKPAEDNFVRCTVCRARNRENLKEDRAFYKKMGICPRCRKHKIYNQEGECPECKAEHAEYKRRRIEKEGTEVRNAYQREYGKKAYAKKKAAGLCPRCGKRKGLNGNVFCGICLDKFTQQKAKTRKLSGWREDAGICRFCEDPVEPGYKVCVKHHQMNIEKARSQKAVEARKEMGVKYGWYSTKGKEVGVSG